MKRRELERKPTEILNIYPLQFPVLQSRLISSVRGSCTGHISFKLVSSFYTNSKKNWDSVVVGNSMANQD